MYFHGAKCDIYIGQGAGKMLLNEIKAVKDSIKIVSPYLSPFLIQELIKLRTRNIDVHLITTDTIEDFNNTRNEKNIHKLLIQNRRVDTKSEEIRNQWIVISKILLYTSLILSVFSLVSVPVTRHIRYLWIILLAIGIYFIYRWLKIKIKNKRIYHYTYTQLFPFKVYVSPEAFNSNTPFLHSKIYLLDDTIAYLGSLNFTRNGLQHNYETRIRIDDKNAVGEIRKEIGKLLYNEMNLPERDIQLWGKQLYPEPIN